MKNTGAFKKLFLFPLFGALFFLFPLISSEAEEPLPRGFRELRLGMDMAAAKEALKKDGFFNYQGDSDVSLLNEPTRSLIDCSGITYIDRAFFQFYEDYLYTIILRLNMEEIDFYSMYTALKKKYGEPRDVSPELILWESGEVLFSLERPVTVKYIDKKVFLQLEEESRAEEAFGKVRRDDLIDEF